MEELKYYFFSTLFLLLILPSILAFNVKVLYFYSACPFSEHLFNLKEKVREEWSGKVEWVEYEYPTNSQKFDEYGIVNPPVALVECFNRSYRIEREEIEESLNSTIYSCFLCDGRFDLNKQCYAGDRFYKECGKCGIKEVFCSQECRWVEGSCENEKECLPGEVRSKDCITLDGCLGISYSFCNSDCEWGGWNECQPISECEPTIHVVVKEEEKRPFPIFLFFILSFLFILSLILLFKFKRKK